MKNIPNTVKSLLETAASCFVSSGTVPLTPHASLNQSITDAQKQAILNFTITDLMALIEYAPYFVTLKIDQAGLDKALDKVKRRKKQREEEDLCLIHGAPRDLMKRLYGMNNGNFSKRRNILKIKNMGAGRPPKCSQEIKKKIWSTWQSLDKNTPESIRFLTIAKKTNLDLHVIWNALHPYIDKA